MDTASLPDGPYRQRARVRTSGGARVRLRDDGGVTRLAELWHHDPLRVLMPDPIGDVLPHVVLLNTAGGLVGGDAIATRVELTGPCRALVTGQSAEKVYRSDGPAVQIANTLIVDDGGWLEWMPQETILFDESRLRRRLTIDLAGTARCLAAEMVVFGRLARGERVVRASLFDRWDLRRDGRLVWTDRIGFGFDAAPVLRAPCGFGGAAAMATLVYAGPGAAGCLAGIRAILGEETGIAAACLGDILLVRALVADPVPLRRRLADVWRHLRAEAGGLPPALPRLWHI